MRQPRFQPAKHQYEVRTTNQYGGVHYEIICRLDQRTSVRYEILFQSESDAAYEMELFKAGKKDFRGSEWD